MPNALSAECIRVHRRQKGEVTLIFGFKDEEDEEEGEGEEEEEAVL